MPFELPDTPKPGIDRLLIESALQPDLRRRLLAERAGILAWAVRGCLEWRRDGLGVVEEVRVATADYRDENDTLRDFIEERCTEAADAIVKRSGFVDPG